MLFTTKEIKADFEKTLESTILVNPEYKSLVQAHGLTYTQDVQGTYTNLVVRLAYICFMSSVSITCSKIAGKIAKVL